MVDLKTLFKEINSTKKNKEPRLEILIIQLYVEHFLNEIITLKSGNMPEQIIKENLSNSNKNQNNRNMGNNK